MDTTLPPETPPAPKATAILIAHNQAAELRRALQALERSKDRDRFEILVIDSGSLDDTETIGEEFPGITLLRLPHHFGATKAMNIATRTAKTDFLFFLSPDVEVAPDTIRLLTEHLEAESDTTAVCPLLVDAAGTPIARIQPLPTRETLAQACAGGEPPHIEPDLTQESIAVGYPGRDALLVRKQFIIGMNYFDARFGEYWADADLALKVRHARKKILLYPAIRATWHASARPAPDDAVYSAAIYNADRVLGAALLLRKHEGFIAGLTFRLSAIVSALLHFDFRLFAALLSGEKVGSQAS
jgi:N-acetylglucosaminyl-diphospho-decaprenol L-rhamnosyltransferase